MGIAVSIATTVASIATSVAMQRQNVKRQAHQMAQTNAYNRRMEDLYQNPQLQNEANLAREAKAAKPNAATQASPLAATLQPTQSNLSTPDTAPQTLNAFERVNTLLMYEGI